MRSNPSFIFIATALLSSIADASLSVPAVPHSIGSPVHALVTNANADHAQDESHADTEALDWASAVGHRVQVTAEVQKMQRQTTAKFSVNQLLQFLDDVDRVEKPLTETEFIPRCLAQVQKVVKMINATFGAEKLEHVVTDECLQNKDFPLASADAFNKKRACQSLVEELTKLQDQELKTGSRKGYFNFCGSYVRNKDADGLMAPYMMVSSSGTEKHTGSVQSAHAANAYEGITAHPSIPFIALTMLGALCIVGAAFFTLRQNKQ